MATLGLLSLAVCLQVVGGLFPILYEDLNPAKRWSEGREQVLSAPRAASLVLLITRNDYEDRPLEEALEHSFAEEGKHVERIPIPGLRDLEYRASQRKGLLGVGPGLLHKWYTRPATVLAMTSVRSAGLALPLPPLRQMPVREARIYCGLPRPFGREDWELSAYRRIGQRVSLLLVAVAALVRFAYDEPILNLFSG